MTTAALFAVMLFYCALVCFNSFRHDQPPLRFLAFIGCAVAVWYGVDALQDLGLALMRRSFDLTVGLEILLPITLAVFRHDAGGRHGRQLRL